MKYFLASAFKFGINILFLQSSIREVSEWLKELPWKGSIRVTVSRVRIPSSLLTKPLNIQGLFLFLKSV